MSRSIFRRGRKGYSADTNPKQLAIITGQRIPSDAELQTHFAIFRGVAMDGPAIAARINCPAVHILPKLLQLELSGYIRRVPSDTPETTIHTKWLRE